MLENTLYKLKNESRLTLGFFGGSITEGAVRLLSGSVSDIRITR